MTNYHRLSEESVFIAAEIVNDRGLWISVILIKQRGNFFFTSQAYWKDGTILKIVARDLCLDISGTVDIWLKPHIHDV